MLGMAAYWLATSLIIPDSNDHGRPYVASVSTMNGDPPLSTRRGGATGHHR